MTPEAPRALLQTDIVDSTRLSEQLGDAAMSSLWASHDRVARDLLRDWRGREIDKSDGFLLLFASATDAAGYALAYHRAIAALNPPLQARAGLHVGRVTTRENPSADVALGAKPLEVEGVAKPITARVMSLAGGGQTLLTADARAALDAASTALRGHGHWRLKGVEVPIELFELVAADATGAAPADTPRAYRVVQRNGLWLPLRECRHSLPAERDAFVDRHDPLHELARRFAGGARLVSILGTAGTGKSRLAQRYGWVWLGDYPGGVWFCDLSQARSVDGIALAVAQGFGARLSDADPIGQLGSVLAARGACLVILDNFEQVARHAESTLGQWLDRTGETHFVVTSREVLGIGGEVGLALAPLSSAHSAVLFNERATAARPDFAPNAEDDDATLPLVELLDGLPLAIELAAARVRVMPPRMLLKRMSERFKLLASTSGRNDRQATLRAAFDWSWELLSAAEKLALAQLSVFEGGFTLAAAEAVLDLSAGDAAAAPWPVDAVQALVEKSFVRPLGDQRFDLLRSVQEYAAEHLRTAGRFEGSGPAAQAAAEARHWVHFASLDEREATAGGCVEIDNLVAACRRAQAAGDAVCAVGALSGAWSAIKLRGPFRSAVDLSAKVKRLGHLTAGQRAVVNWVAGSALHLLGREREAGACYVDGLAEARVALDRYNEAELLRALGDHHAAHGRTEQARADVMASLTIATAIDARDLQIRALNSLGTQADHAGSHDEAQAAYSQALGLAQAAGDRRWQGGLLGNLATLHYGQGRLDEARRDYEQALLVVRDAGDRRWEGNTRCNLGMVNLDQKRTAEARAQLEAAFEIACELGHVRLESVALCNLGLVAEAEGRHDVAQPLLKRASRVAATLADRRWQGELEGYLGLCLARLGRPGDARDHFDAGETLLVPTQAADDLGLLLCHRAEAEQLLGNGRAARVALDRADAIVGDTAARSETALGRRVARLRLGIG